MRRQHHEDDNSSSRHPPATLVLVVLQSASSSSAHHDGGIDDDDNRPAVVEDVEDGGGGVVVATTATTGAGSSCDEYEYDDDEYECCGGGGGGGGGNDNNRTRRRRLPRWCSAPSKNARDEFDDEDDEFDRRRRRNGNNRLAVVQPAPDEPAGGLDEDGLYYFVFYSWRGVVGNNSSGNSDHDKISNKTVSCLFVTLVFLALLATYSVSSSQSTATGSGGARIGGGIATTTKTKSASSASGGEDGMTMMIPTSTNVVDGHGVDHRRYFQNANGGEDGVGNDNGYGQNWFLYRVTNWWYRLRHGGHDRCSCYNPKAQYWTCCQRALLVEHKFGTFLISGLFQPNVKTLRLVPRVDNWTLPNQGGGGGGGRQVDYRHVVVTRNWYDALASGYLYHRSGRECWLTTQGQPRKYHNWTIDWDEQLWTDHNRRRAGGGGTEDDEEFRSIGGQDDDGTGNNVTKLPVRQNNESICAYLQRSSEEDGMLAYMDWALQRYYGYLVEYHERVTANNTAGSGSRHHGNGEESKSMFLCYEDFMNATKRPVLYERALDFLFPGGSGNHPPMASSSSSYGNNEEEGAATMKATDDDIDGASLWAKGPPTPLTESMYDAVNGNNNNSAKNATSATATQSSSSPPPVTKYEGGHATDHDPELRARLKQLVEKFDREVFGGTVARSDAVFGCGVR